MNPDQLRTEAQQRVMERIAAAAARKDQQTARRARQQLARRHGLETRHAVKLARLQAQQENPAPAAEAQPSRGNA